MVVLAVLAQVLGERGDALGHERDLNLRPARVARARAEALDDLALAVLGYGHACVLEGSVLMRRPRLAGCARAPRRAASPPPAPESTQTGARHATAVRTRSAGGDRRGRARGRSRRSRSARRGRSETEA